MFKADKLYPLNLNKANIYGLYRSNWDSFIKKGKMNYGFKENSVIAKIIMRNFIFIKFVFQVNRN